jgi:hypothetical protein
VIKKNGGEKIRVKFKQLEIEDRSYFSESWYKPALAPKNQFYGGNSGIFIQVLNSKPLQPKYYLI